MAHTPHTAVVSKACLPSLTHSPSLTKNIIREREGRCVVTTPSLTQHQPRWYFSLIKFFFASIFSLTHTTTTTTDKKDDDEWASEREDNASIFISISHVCNETTTPSPPPLLLPSPSSSQGIFRQRRTYTKPRGERKSVDSKKNSWIYA